MPFKVGFYVLLSINIFVLAYDCSLCIDTLAAEAEDRNHDVYNIRLKYNSSWNRCDTPEGRWARQYDYYGCFRMQVSRGPVPDGYFALMHGPISSLFTINGRSYLKQTPKDKVIYVNGDGTYYEFTFCYENACFLKETSHLINYPQQGLFYIPTIVTRTAITTTKTTTITTLPPFTTITPLAPQFFFPFDFWGITFLLFGSAVCGFVCNSVYMILKKPSPGKTVAIEVDILD